MSALRQLLNRRLTFTGSMLVLAALVVVGGISYEICGFVSKKLLEAQVRAAFPHVCDQVRAQRGQLVAAIEAYKASLGRYPPDHVIGDRPPVVEPITNQLLYELVGTAYDATNQTYTADGFERVQKHMIRSMFNASGFGNAATNPESVRHFLSSENLFSREVHDDPDVNVLSFVVELDGIDDSAAKEFEFSSWRYVSSSPTNNRGAFDLWIEIRAGDRTVIIGNWKAVE